MKKNIFIIIILIIMQYGCRAGHLEEQKDEQVEVKYIWEIYSGGMLIDKKCSHYMDIPWRRFMTNSFGYDGIYYKNTKIICTECQ